MINLIKRLKEGVFSLFFLSLFPLVSAQVYGGDFYFIRDGAERFIDFVISFGAPFFQILLGEYVGGIGEFSSGEIFFVRILLFIMLYIIIHFSLKKTPLGENKNVNFIISLTVSILAVRFMSQNEMVLGVLLPYGAFGITITMVIPFIIFFYVVEMARMGSLGRRLMWGAYMSCILILWIYNYDKYSDLSNKIYMGLFALIVLVMLFDTSIHQYFKTWEFRAFYRSTNRKTIADLQAEYMRIAELDTTDAKARRKDIEKQLKTLGANIS